MTKRALTGKAGQAGTGEGRAPGGRAVAEARLDCELLAAGAKGAEHASGTAVAKEAELELEATWQKRLHTSTTAN